jgi:hypothetical protein
MQHEYRALEINSGLLSKEFSRDGLAIDSRTGQFIELHDGSELHKIYF